MGLWVYKQLVTVLLRAALEALKVADPDGKRRITQWVKLAIQIIEGLPLVEARQLKESAYESACDAQVEPELHAMVFNAGLSTTETFKAPKA